MKRHNYYLYIMANRSRTIYVGVTNNIERRVLEHKEKRVPGFTAKYNIGRLVFYQRFPNINEAIQAEKKVKAWRREKKIALIEAENPHWKDLAADWY